ncbi:MAG: type II toxin-antitoxin system HicB family antitoxin [Magnetococcales bacterium]|nr:type II toxin-antitoxin system HicB family antitoxin [Magnetococcales bacterium]
MTDIRYPAILEPQEPNGFFVSFPDLEDTFTEGATQEEALRNASEVLTAMLGWRVDHGHPIPTPTVGMGSAHYIAPDAKTQAAILLRQTRENQTLADLARTMETSWSAVKRLEDPHHWPSLKQLEKAAAANGKPLVLSFE